MDVIVNSKELVCIEYPAIVKNVDKMLETLGGEKTINDTYADPNARINLKFRPDDVYCKALHGERCKSTNILLKVVCKRRKVPKNDNDSENNKIVGIEVVGNIHQSYKFKSLCDYQYLPIEKKDNNTYESILPALVPTGLLPSTWLEEPCPLLIVPPLFSRIENPASYHFKKSTNSLEETNGDSKIIGRARSRRSGFGIYINSDDPTPVKPAASLGKIFKTVINHKKEIIDKLKMAFDERPIWSSNALSIYTNIDKAQLKFTTPAFGYYFLTSPWRGLWVRFGYDPRKTPEAKIYQLLDIRIRIPPGLSSTLLDGRRSNQIKLINKMNYSKPTVRVIEKQKLAQTTSEDDVAQTSKAEDLELRYKFKEGCLPKFRQVFYQLCDIELDSVKNLISSDDGEKSYHERDGWLSPGVLEKCRQLILADIANSFNIIKKAELEKGPKQSEENVEEEEEYEIDEDLSDNDFDDDEMDISFE